MEINFPLVDENEFPPVDEVEFPPVDENKICRRLTKLKGFDFFSRSIGSFVP
jgi:hypothetical protein